MTNFFPSGIQTVNSPTAIRGAQDIVPIASVVVPGVQGSNGFLQLASPPQIFSQNTGAIAAGASATIIAALANARWFLQLFKVYLSATGTFEIQDNAVSIGFFQATLNTLISPFGELQWGMIGNLPNTALTIKNTTGVACTYFITAMGQWV